MIAALLSSSSLWKKREPLVVPRDAISGVGGSAASVDAVSCTELEEIARKDRQNPLAKSPPLVNLSESNSDTRIGLYTER